MCKQFVKYSITFLSKLFFDCIFFSGLGIVCVFSSVICCLKQYTVIYTPNVFGKLNINLLLLYKLKKSKLLLK